MVYNAESLGEMQNRYLELEGKLQRLTRQISSERNTLSTIQHIRGKAGAMLGVTHLKSDKVLASSLGRINNTALISDVTSVAQPEEAGLFKPIESSLMYCEAFQRLAARECERNCLQYQATSLAAALGPHKLQLAAGDAAEVEGSP